MVLASCSPAVLRSLDEIECGASALILSQVIYFWPLILQTKLFLDLNTNDLAEDTRYHG